MAQTLNTPDVLTQPIAENGTKNSIPATNDQSLGLMSQSTGFPAICSDRIADGGKAPRRADFNGAFNLVSQHHFFLQNGGCETFRQDVSDAIGGYPAGARLWYVNQAGESLIVRSLIQNNTYNFNDDPSYIDGLKWVVDMQSGISAGIVLPFMGTTAPDGFLVCDGSEVSRTTYARLYAAIGDTYGAGDGSTTFNLPDLDGRFLEGGTAGTYKAAGLPNINGTLSIPSYNTGAQSAFSDGCFSTAMNGGNARAIGYADQFYQRSATLLDASRSSAVYKNDVTTVQPNSLTALFVIKY